jgi:LPS-assembly lipoprotein
MWSPDRRAVLGLALAVPVLAACGFEPMYGDGAPARRLLGAVALDPIPGRDGFDFRERFETRAGRSGAPDYLLAVTLATESEGRAIREDNAITRFNLRGTAGFVLRHAATGAVLTSGQAEAFTAYNAIANAFATSVAERDAERRLSQALADQVLLRLSATAADWMA